MFLSLSTTLAKFGKLRIGAGMRMTKKNWFWMLFVFMFIWIFKLTWYVGVLTFWCIYAVVYGFVALIKLLVKAIIRAREKNKTNEAELINNIVNGHPQKQGFFDRNWWMWIVLGGIGSVLYFVILAVGLSTPSPNVEEVVVPQATMDVAEETLEENAQAVPPAPELTDDNKLIISEEKEEPKEQSAEKTEVPQVTPTVTEKPEEEESEKQEVVEENKAAGEEKTEPEPEPVATPEPTPEKTESPKEDVEERTVYIGETGSKYHRKSCSTLSGNKYAISLSDAKAQGRTPCKRCKP